MAANSERLPDTTNVRLNGLEIEVVGIEVPNDTSDPRYWEFWSRVVEISQEGLEAQQARHGQDHSD